MKKNFKQNKNKSSILSFALAIILTFSLNYSPISLISKRLSNFNSSAYSSKVTQTYYGMKDVAAVTTESNISSGNYANGTNKYFSDSSNNYNILSHYTEMYENLFKKYVDEYLVALDENTEQYNGLYSKYLEYVGYSSASAYYNAKTSSLNVSSFKEYFENLTTKDTTWTVNEEEFTLNALGTKSEVYNGFANYITNEQKANEDTNIGSADDFYTNSVSYLRVKAFIDSVIEKTTVVYSYDGKTQTDYVGAIIAKNAPVSQTYYYVNDDYEKLTETNISFATHTYMPTGGTTYYLKEVYYFGNRSDLENGSASAIYNDFINDYAVTTYDSNDSYCTLSYFEENTFNFRLIEPGEFGYMDSTHPTYYRYSSVPFEATNSNYTIYVVDDDVTPNEKATYDSLYFVNVITSEELEKDRNNLIENNERGYRDTTGCFYVKVPLNDTYFKKLFSTVSELNYNNTKSIFTKNNDSNIYLKVSSSYSKTTNLVYIDETNLSDFIVKYASYSYKLSPVNFDELSSNTDYEKITTSYSNYYKEDFNLYFKKNRTYFTSTDISYDSTYETESSTNVEYEMTTVSTEKYDNFYIYALVDTFEINGVDYKVVSSDNVSKLVYEKVSSESVPSTDYDFYYKHTLTSDGNVDSTNYQTENDEKVIYVLLSSTKIGENDYTVITSESLENIRNLYASVPVSVSNEIFGESETTPLYYKHSTKLVRQIYIVDNAENANNNEVYKNLNYKVLSDDEYKSTYYTLVEVASTDENYNKNFKLYYKLSNVLTDANNYSADANLFVQNLITDKNAVYIIDDSLTSTDKVTYKALYYTPLTTTEFNAESDLYVLINELDSNYSATYTKLYYKYKENPSANRKIYVYSSNESVLYNSFYNTNNDYLASDYELIQASDPNYVAGTNLYYKKNRIETTINNPQTTYYYYRNSSAVTLSANSYYAISFYVYTNGNYYDENDNLVEGNIQASVYIADSKNIISDISIEHIETNGKWQKYVAFISTNTLSSSTITISLYMGDKNSIAGTLTEETISGSVMFDEIQITLIGETDYNKHTIDAKSVLEKVTEYDTETENLPVLTSTGLTSAIAGTYELVKDFELESDRILDSNNVYYFKHNVDGETVLETYELDSLSRKNVYVYVASETYEYETKAVTVKTTSHTYTNVDSYKNEVILIDETKLASGEKLDNKFKNDTVISNWNANFNYDNNDELIDTINNLTFVGNEDGYTENNNWHYYISRDVSGQGNYERLEAYQNAYTDKKVTVSVINESTIDKTNKKSDTSATDEAIEAEIETNSDVKTIESTFNLGNNVLKITNTDKLKSLGVISTPFTINQLEYYKLTVWVYSPDEDATATIKLESVLYTASTSNKGSLLSTSASNVNAHLADYSTEPTNEYSWIPVTFYIEGNAFENKKVRLVLLADENSTVYFDNISIEKVTSSIYDTTNSDSDTLTYCLSLSPSTSLISAGVTNGYFNLMTFTGNYNVDIDYSLPRTAENWTAVTDNSTSAIAGVIPTSNSYVSNTNNFFTKYNNSAIVNSNGDNIYAIHAPKFITSPLDSSLEQEFEVNHNYKIYSSSMSLSSTSVYTISFEFLAGYEFTGNLVANLYSGSVSATNVVSSFTVPSNEIQSGWNKYSFYVETSDSATIYLEIGVSEATGTCFFQKVKNIKSTETSIDSIRDGLVKDENVETSTLSINEYSSLSNTRFVKLNDKDFSVHTDTKNNYNLYDSKNYTDSNINESTFTVGKSGTAVASYYTSSTSSYYTVEIKSIDYIKANGNEKEIATDADGIFYIKEIASTDGTETTYKLYSDSMFTVEVLGFDVSGNGNIEDEELSNFVVAKSGSTVKVTLNETDNTATTISETNYEYKFNEDVIIDNIIIPASELNNNYSQNVLVIANSNSSDFVSLSNAYTYSLASSSYYAVKLYVKTSDLGDNGLNINIDSVTVNWTNINTTKLSNADENGFVCYELWIKTNTSSFSKVTTTLTLGTKGKSVVGYALVAGIEIVKFESETLFNEYCDSKDELYTENDANSVAKRYFGTESTSTDTNNSSDENNNTSTSSTTWATFFYILSSLLLAVVLIMAIVAVIIRRHPIKKSKRVKDDSFVIVEQNKNKNKKSSKANEVEKEESISLKEENSEQEVETDSQTSEDNTQGF